MTDFTRKPLFIPAAGSFWKGIRASSSIPEDAILTEAGEPILTEAGDFLLTES